MANQKGMGFSVSTTVANQNYSSERIFELTAGENLSFKDVCYFKSDGKMWKADADAEVSIAFIAIAVESISADAKGHFIRSGVIKDTAWNWTTAQALYVDTTAGSITATAPSGSGDIVYIVGYALNADTVLVDLGVCYVEVA